MILTIENKYFAASNTVSGFVSYYDDIFGRCDEIYVIKGGSGTGKSRFMREVAEHYLKNEENANIEYFYCSFDPDSLDGIIVDRRMAVIDGTSPHVYEPTLPGAKENMVDLGAFWDSRALMAKRLGLLSLMKQKKEHFRRAYGYLASYGELMKVREGMLLPFVDRLRVRADAAKRVSELSVGEKCEERIRPTAAFGRRGVVDFFDAERRGDVKANAVGGLGYLWLSEIIAESKKFSLPMEIAYDPLFAQRPYRVTVGDGAVFSLYDVDMTDHMTCDIGNTIDRAEQIGNCADTILDMASAELSEAANVHFNIEEIYVSAMDFEKKEKYTKKFLKELQI